MPAIPHEALVDKALAVLREALEAKTVTAPEALRFALAYLYEGGDRDPFDRFWRAAIKQAGPTGADEFGRFQTMRAAYCAICRGCGREGW
jgi:hypothetical protein